MKKSLLIFFAVIAAASALRLPVGLKSALVKIENVRQKDAGYESEAMADVIPEETYESEGMADVIPEGTYESEAMADVVPVPYETAAMAEDIPQSPVLVQKVIEKMESLRRKAEEYESEYMADIVPEVAQEQEQAYESLHMADVAYESKAMADEPYESADMEDEYENQAMADEVDSAESDESAVSDEDRIKALLADPAIRFRADGGDIAFGRRFAADGADEIASAIAKEVIAELRRFAAISGVELNRRFHADGDVKSRKFPIRQFLPRLENN